MKRASDSSASRAVTTPKPKKDADTLALEKRIGDILGLSVSVDHKDPGGTVQIRYRDLDQLDDILKRLESGRGDDQAFRAVRLSRTRANSDPQRRARALVEIEISSRCAIAAAISLLRRISSPASPS